MQTKDLGELGVIDLLKTKEDCRGEDVCRLFSRPRINRQYHDAATAGCAVVASQVGIIEIRLTSVAVSESTFKPNPSLGLATSQADRH